MKINDQERKFLEAFNSMLPVVAPIIKKVLQEYQVDEPPPLEKLQEAMIGNTMAHESSRRMKYWYDGIGYAQNQLVLKVLKDLGRIKTAEELRTMFSSEEILGTDNWQQQILIAPEEHSRVSEGYTNRYNTEDPVVTSDGVKLYVWTNWGLFKTTRNGPVEGNTPKFVRAAQQHGIEIVGPQ